MGIFIFYAFILFAVFILELFSSDVSSSSKTILTEEEKEIQRLRCIESIGVMRGS